MAVEANIEHVHDMKKIMEYPILSTPALVINEKLACSGKVPSVAEVRAYITSALTK